MVVDFPLGKEDALATGGRAVDFEVYDWRRLVRPFFRMASALATVFTKIWLLSGALKRPARHVRSNVDVQAQPQASRAPRYEPSLADSISATALRSVSLSASRR